MFRNLMKKNLMGPIKNWEPTPFIAQISWRYKHYLIQKAPSNTNPPDEQTISTKECTKALATSLSEFNVFKLLSSIVIFFQPIQLQSLWITEKSIKIWSGFKWKQAHAKEVHTLKLIIWDSFKIDTVLKQTVFCSSFNKMKTSWWSIS